MKKLRKKDRRGNDITLKEVKLKDLEKFNKLLENDIEIINKNISDLIDSDDSRDIEPTEI